MFTLLPRIQFSANGPCAGAAVCFFGIVILVVGCKTTGTNIVSLPDAEIVRREQLVVHSNFHMPRRHRLMDELTARRSDISQVLDLPVSDEPINVYLFESEIKFRQFIRHRHPLFPNRRALFVKNDTSLNVYAFWGDRVGEDLRHEVTHGYLHSVVPNMPLWLDEGTAEYFEVTRGQQGFNRTHVYTLANKLRRGEWHPNLGELELVSNASEMTQLQYAEAWLWVHFLLDFSAESRTLLQKQFYDLVKNASVDPLWPQVYSLIPNAEEVVVKHLGELAEKL